MTKLVKNPLKLSRNRVSRVCYAMPIKCFVSHRPQKKRKINLLRDASTQSGIGMSDATYQIRERAKVLITIAHPRIDNLRGRQVSSSKPEGLMKTPNTLTHADDHCKSKRGSSRPLQSPNHRPLHLPKFSFEPEPL